MPSERTRRKDDTWTTDELNKALKGSRDDGRRRHRREDEERQRRHHDDVNGDRDDRRRKHKEEERRSHRDASEDKRRHRKERDERIELTEEDRDRQRRERRERREKKEPGGKPERREKKKDTPLIEDDDDRRRHRDRDNENKKHRGDDRERRHKDDDDRRRRRDDDDGERRRRKDDESRRRRDDDDRRRHRDEDDRKRHRDEDSRRRQRGEDDSRRRVKEERNKHREEDDRERRRRHREEENEDDRERQRRERRERREKKDREKRGEDEKKDHGKDDRRHRDRPEEKPRDKETGRARRREPEPESEEEEEQQGGGGGDEDYNYDDDDFEDYDDDFEDDDDDDEGDDDKPNENLSEMDALMKAMDEENTRLANGSSRSVRSNRSDETDESEEAYRQPVPKPNRGRTFIDFVSAKQVVLSSKTASRTRKRGEDLLQMIELDKARYDMFDLPPVREYEMYIRNFGRSNTKQAYVQTNEDNIDRDIQTEEIDTKEKWTQYPSDDLLGVGGDGIDPEAVRESQSSGHVDSSRLAKFVEKAGQVIGMLLDEERDWSGKKNEASSKSNIGFSQGFSELGSLKFTQGRHVTHACFCPNQPNMLLTVFSPPTQTSDDNPVDRYGLICAWNVTDLTYPHRILCCEAQPVCCCFSPSKASLAFAGLHDGSLTVWDLREGSSMHRRVTLSDQDHVLRFPTYNTARVLEDDNHHSPVTTILPVHSLKLGSKPNESSDTSTGLSFQLATVEQNGVVNLWVVTEISSPDTAGSEVDLGLAPGGRIKLLKSSSITIHSPSRSLSSGNVQAFEMQLLPSDLNHFYVGTDSGSVIHGVRFGSRGYPHYYSPAIESPVNVSTIDFSPFGSPYMLAGCDNGALYLYHTKSGTPLLSWPVFCKGCSVRCVRWSRSRPTVFFVLDEGSTIHVMDLLESDSQPIQGDQVTQGRAVTMCLSNDLKQTGGSRAQLLLGLDNGRTEVHNIVRQLTEMQTLEEDFLEKYVDRF